MNKAVNSRAADVNTQFARVQRDQLFLLICQCVEDPNAGSHAIWPPSPSIPKFRITADFGSMPPSKPLTRRPRGMTEAQDMSPTLMVDVNDPAALAALFGSDSKPAFLYVERGPG